MMDSVGIRDRDTRKGAVSPVQNETICGQPHPTVPSTPPHGPLKLPAGPKMRTAALQPFFGREDELRKIADALDPNSRTWGALIDGPGGKGKTSLAVRAAYDAPPDAFKKIIFISLKTRELDDDGRSEERRVGKECRS